MRLRNFAMVIMLAAAFSVARADTLQYVLVLNSETDTFDLASKPSVSSTATGADSYMAFTISGVHVQNTTGTLTFSTNATGNYFIDLPYTDEITVASPLFSGPLASPTLLTGVFPVIFSITSQGFYEQGTLTVSNAPQVAVTLEPSSFVLLGSGLLGVVGVLRRRVRNA